MLQGIDPDDIDFEGKDLEKHFTTRTQIAEILMELMDRGITDETGTTVGKTIVFCATQNHAEAMKQLLDELYPHYGGRLGEVITSRWNGSRERRPFGPIQKQGLPSHRL